jgi:hypothetical protein
MSAHRSSKLSRQEIAVIKAMLAKHIPSQDILAYFSRPGRSVNMLRISEIRSGSKHADILPASEAVLDHFIRAYEKALAEGVMAAGPLDQGTLLHLLHLSSDEPPQLAISENETVEFKEAFNWASPEHYAKAMAAFANNKGGYLLFGINNLGIVIGTKRDKFEKVDSGKITQFLNRHFQPAISWDRAVMEVAGKSVCVLYTYPAVIRPVVCVADKHEVIRDGDIYFRYGGRNDRIRSGELRHLMQQREHSLGQAWLSKFSRMAEIGLQHVGILNGMSGEVDGPSGPFLIDKDLLDQVKFVQEGHFTDKAGAPALKLVGEVQPVDGDRIQPTLTVREPTHIGETEMLAAFIDQTPVPAPKEYIRSAALRQAVWGPLYYFIHLAGISVAQAIRLIEKERGGSAHVKAKLVERLRAGTDCHTAANATVLPVRQRILARASITLDSRDAAGRFLFAILTLRRDEMDLDYLLPLLRTCYDDFFFGDSAQLKGHIRKAASHLDWLLYGVAEKETASEPIEEAMIG